jgi:methylated-DNA-[protein]-cysteine S-methyltransferase
MARLPATAPTVATLVASPVDALLLVADDAGLRGLYFAEHRGRPAVPPPGAALVDARALIGADDDAADDASGGARAVLARARTQLAEYFDGGRTAFDLPLAPRGTAFQQRVWALLRAIPYGETRSYGELAQLAGVPRAARAIGVANARNPISIVVPCHRVVARDGALTGFGGGISRKRALLLLERMHHRIDDA